MGGAIAPARRDAVRATCKARLQLECDNAREDVIRVALAMDCEAVAAIPHHALREAVLNMQTACALMARMETKP